MYCYNCGKKIGDNAVVCVNCGVSTINVLTKKKGKGKSIAGFVLGLVGIFYSFCAFVSSLAFFLDGETNFAATITFAFFVYGISITGLCLSLAARKMEKNSFNKAGFILNTIASILSTATLFFV